ncbi:hypothetical protein KIW84_064534 [Lathyrus oleraceus]|uniref:Uncharacterized protein n=1 Tax=Pisum sativum TaxID=3888 RepID=A0A9D5AB68_PEA|nr:hypothetical protein KIW84_064534 [Pisum sativum]
MKMRNHLFNRSGMTIAGPWFYEACEILALISGILGCLDLLLKAHAGLMVWMQTCSCALALQGLYGVNGMKWQGLELVDCYLIWCDFILLQDSHDSQDGKQSPADMTAFFLTRLSHFCAFQVQNLLQQMSINELRAEIGVELSQSPATLEKPKEEESSKEEGSS